MTLEDPILAYIAGTNEEAIILKQFLEANGIIVEFTEDYAASVLGFRPEQAFNQPQIWISRRDSKLVVQLLKDYEGILLAKNEKQSIEVPEKIESICFDCGQTTIFPGSLAGSVQECSHCLSWLDVGEDDESFGDEWETAGSEEE
jgi:hypothetical protein